jgi:hypothetical protein
VSLPSEGLKAAADTAKQVIALATGVLTLTITFLGKSSPPASMAPIAVAWAAFLVSIVAGVWTLTEITTALNALDKLAWDEANAPPGAPPPAPRPFFGAFHSRIKAPGMVMMVAFFVGLGFIVIANFIPV